MQLNYISIQGGIRMALDSRAGLVQEMNDALCNQICKEDLARRMHTDKLLLSLDMTLKTLVLKLWGITKSLQERKRADCLNLLKSEPILWNQSQLLQLKSEQKHRLPYSVAKALVHYLCVGVSIAVFVVLWLLMPAGIRAAGTARSSLT